MGANCLAVGCFVNAQVGEELHGAQFTHTFAVVNGQGKPVCIPHGGCTLELLTVDAKLAQYPVLAGLRSGQTVHYQILGTGRGEKDVVTLKSGEIVDLMDLGTSTYQITAEKPA